MKQSQVKKQKHSNILYAIVVMSAAIFWLAKGGTHVCEGLGTEVSTQWTINPPGSNTYPEEVGSKSWLLDKESVNMIGVKHCKSASNWFGMIVQFSYFESGATQTLEESFLFDPAKNSGTCDTAFRPVTGMIDSVKSYWDAASSLPNTDDLEKLFFTDQSGTTNLDSHAVVASEQPIQDSNLVGPIIGFDVTYGRH